MNPGNLTLSPAETDPEHAPLSQNGPQQPALAATQAHVLGQSWERRPVLLVWKQHGWHCRARGTVLEDVGTRLLLQVDRVPPAGEQIWMYGEARKGWVQVFRIGVQTMTERLHRLRVVVPTGTTVFSDPGNHSELRLLESGPGVDTFA